MGADIFILQNKDFVDVAQSQVSDTTDEKLDWVAKDFQDYIIFFTFFTCNSGFLICLLIVILYVNGENQLVMN